MNKLQAPTTTTSKLQRNLKLQTSNTKRPLVSENGAFDKERQKKAELTGIVWYLVDLGDERLEIRGVNVVDRSDEISRC